MERPPTYNKQPHCLIRQAPDCIECDLGKENQAHNKRQWALEESKRVFHRCVGGAGPEDLQQVELVIISDACGHYENLAGFPMVDITEQREERRKGLLYPNNAGSIIRMALTLMYGLDTYQQCWFTNAVKCYPGKLKALDTHVKKCSQTWLAAEMQTIDEYVPEVPILIAGGQGLKGLCHVYKNDGAQLLEYGLQGCRRRKGLKLGQHPVVVTFNPASAARSQAKIETGVREGKNGKLYVTENQWLDPILPGSPVDKFVRDLYLLAPFINREDEEVP